MSGKWAWIGAFLLVCLPIYGQVIFPNAPLSDPTQSGITIPAPVISDPDQLSRHLLVVCNQNDPESLELAQEYARGRQIAADHVLPLNCSLQEEISRDEYEKTLRQPITSYLIKNNWLERSTVDIELGGFPQKILIATRNDIWAMVLMRGVPLKIAEEAHINDALEKEPQLQTNAAAVDSELASLPTYGLPLGGYLPNPFYDAPASIRAGPELSRKLILVTRLDGPTAADVTRMMEDSLIVEKKRLCGLAVIDSRGRTDVKDSYALGDLWLTRAKNQLQGAGWSIDYDDKETLIPDSDPCNHIALYLGWYSAQAEGPCVTLPSRFVPGAIAYHIHSLSAGTVRSGTSNWVGPLIDHGADATMGTVYEPYLDLTPHLDIFMDRLLSGNTLAEAAYASQKGLSWMVTVLGDPLYQPFQVPLTQALTQAETDKDPMLSWLLLQKLRQNWTQYPPVLSWEDLNKFLPADGAGSPLYEGWGDLLKNGADSYSGTAVQAYQKALTDDPDPIDQIRIGLKLAELYQHQDKADLANLELQDLHERYPLEAQRFKVPDHLAAKATP